MTHSKDKGVTHYYTNILFELFFFYYDILSLTVCLVGPFCLNGFTVHISGKNACEKNMYKNILIPSLSPGASEYISTSGRSTEFFSCCVNHWDCSLEFAGLANVNLTLIVSGRRRSDG